METDTGSLLARIRDLENKIESGVIVTQSKDRNAYVSEKLKEPEKQNMELPKAVPEDVRHVVENWQSIVANMGQPMKTYLKEARLSLGGDNRLVIVVKEGLASDYLIKNPDNKELLQRAVSEAARKEIELEIQSLADNKMFEDFYVDLSRIVHMEIEIEDE